MTAPSEARDHSYERFARQPFYQQIDGELIRLAPTVHTATDLATGTGAIVDHLLELGKLSEPFRVIGVDTSERDLEIARQKFARFGRSVEFHQGSVESMPFIPDESQELITFCNAIHLTNIPEALAEASRIAAPGATLLINSAYEKTTAFPPDTQAKRMMGVLLLMARRTLKEQGIEEFQDPVDLLKFSVDDYRKFVEEAGFTNVKIEIHRVNLDRQAMKAFANYDEFAKGALPGIPVEDSTAALVAAVDPTYDRFNTDVMPRGMMFLTARKPLLQDKQAA